MADNGVVTVKSAHGVKDTIDRLAANITAKGMKVFARIDQPKAPTRSGLPLRPTELLIFGNAKGGTPLMQSRQTIGIDLPFKALAFEEADGAVWLCYNDPAWLVARHGMAAAEVTKRWRRRSPRRPIMLSILYRGRASRHPHAYPRHRCRRNDRPQADGAARLAGPLNGKAMTRLTLTDVFAPAKPVFSGAIGTSIVTADLATPGMAEKLVGARPDIIFHTAGIVSAEAELDFEKGYRSNLDGMLALLRRCAPTGDGYRPQIDLHLVLRRLWRAVPGHHRRRISSHAAHLLRHPEGHVRAPARRLHPPRLRRRLGLRLPAICVRPGKPNKAASGFYSSIIREPLAGHEAVLPVGREQPAHPRFAARGGGLPHSCGGGLSRDSSAPASTSPCPACPAPSPSRSKRCGGSPATRSPPASAASPIRW